jgi:arylformamidase
MIIDISRTLWSGTAVWPGDTLYSLDRTQAIEEGQSVNLTTLTLSAHTGTHIDAPYHFNTEGTTIDQLDLHPYWGQAQVVTVDRAGGPITPADLAGYDLALAPRLLIRSPVSDLEQTFFPDEFIYPAPELADSLGDLGIVLLGTDGPSMDHQHSKSLDGHHALKRRGIAILEWLDLSLAADGLYELVALPLKIEGGDGSPVRAVLRAQAQ